MITGIIMASGFSRRMGEDKLMIEIDGERIIDLVIKACIHSELDDIILVYRDQGIKSIGDKYGIKTAYNPNAHLGQAQSVITGLQHSQDHSSYMFLVGDQPFLRSKLIDDLIAEFKLQGENIIVPYFNNVIGMPILFPNRFKSDLMRIEGDKGGREIIKANMDSVGKLYYESPYLGMDVDTREDLKRILNMTWARD